MPARQRTRHRCRPSSTGRRARPTPPGPTLPFAVDLYGERVQTLTVAQDGYVVAGDLLTTRSHQISFADLDRRIVAPYSTAAEITGGTAGWGTTTVEGRRASCATWTDLTGRDPERANTFQLLLVERADRGEGAFDVLFGYWSLRWGYGRAGFSDGSGRPGSVVEIAGSGEESAFLDTDPTGLARLSTRSDVYSTAPDGTDLRRLTTHPAADSACHGAGTTPSFTADGADVHVQSLDGTSPRQVTDAVGDELPPSFAPDGALVHTALVGQRIDVHPVESEGARPRRLTTDPAAETTPDCEADSAAEADICAEVAVSSSDAAERVEALPAMSLITEARLSSARFSASDIRPTSSRESTGNRSSNRPAANPSSTRTVRANGRVIIRPIPIARAVASTAARTTVAMIRTRVEE